MNKSVKERGCVVMFFAPFVLLGLVVLGLGIFHTYNIFRSANWVETDAKIIHTDFDTHYERKVQTDKTIAHYQYNFGGKTYTGERIAFGYGFNNVEPNYEIYQVLSKAAEIKIFVNPNTPNQSVIVRGFNNRVVVMLTFGVMWCFLVGIFVYPIFTMKILSSTERKIVFSLLGVMWLIGLLIILGNHIPIENEIIVVKPVLQPNL